MRSIKSQQKKAQSVAMSDGKETWAVGQRIGDWSVKDIQVYVDCDNEMEMHTIEVEMSNKDIVTINPDYVRWITFVEPGK